MRRGMLAANFENKIDDSRGGAAISFFSIFYLVVILDHMCPSQLATKMAMTKKKV